MYVTSSITDLTVSRRSGTDLTFLEVLYAVRTVYHFSFPLAFLLAFGGFVTCGTLSWTRPWKCSAPTRSASLPVSASFNEKTTPTCIGPPRSASLPAFPTFSKEARTTSATHPFQFFVFLVQRLLDAICIPTLTLDLAALSARGAIRIAHDASFVHPNLRPSTSPCAAMLCALKVFIEKTHERDAALFGKGEGSKHALGTGLSLPELAAYHVARVRASPALNRLHKQIAGAECALVWEVFSAPWAPGGRDGDNAAVAREEDRIVPASWIEQWLGEERLPDGWRRPAREVQLLSTRRLAGEIEKYK